MKRPIDVVRDGPGRFMIGEPEEGAIEDTFQLDDTLYIVKKRAVYALYLADDLDPKRQNPNVQNSQQLSIKAGTESDIVSRTFLTAKEVFRADWIADRFVLNEILRLCLQTTKELLAAEVTTILYASELNAALTRAETGKASTIPAVPDAFDRVKTFIQKIEHSMQSVFKLVRYIYADELDTAKDKFDHYATYISNKHGADSSYSAFALQFVNFCKTIRNVRHCAEHSKPNLQELIVRDFRLNVSFEVQPPSVEILHEKTPIKQQPVLDFMVDFNETLLEFAETLLVYLADDISTILLTPPHTRPWTDFDLSFAQSGASGATELLLKLFDRHSVRRACNAANGFGVKQDGMFATRACDAEYLPVGKVGYPAISRP